MIEDDSKPHWEIPDIVGSDPDQDSDKIINEFWNETLVPEEIRNDIMSEVDLNGLTNFLSGLVKMKADGVDHLPPLILVIIKLPDDKLEEAKETLCDQAGLMRWQFDQVLEERGGLFMPIAILTPDEKWEESRHQWMFDQGRKWFKIHKDEGVRPLAICLASEVWYAFPDEDDPKSFNYDVAPADQPNKEEGFMIAVQTMDQRNRMHVCPIDRDPEGAMIIGPPNELGKQMAHLRELKREDTNPNSKPLKPSKTHNLLGLAFWRGFFMSLCIEKGLIDEKGNWLKKRE